MYNIIEYVAETTLKNEKQKRLAEHCNNESFKKIVEYTLNPRIIFGIKPDTKWLDGVEFGTNQIDEKTFELLDKLKNREYTGHKARDAVIEHIASLNRDCAELFIRVLRKDFRAGFSVSTVNKIWKNLIPTQLYMRCSLLSDRTWEKWNFAKGIYSQIKMDGLFLACDVLNNVTQFTTRQNTIVDSPHLENLKQELGKFNGYQLHGELVMYQNGEPLPRHISNGYANSISKGGVIEDETIIPKFIVWDIIPLDEVVKGQYSKQVYKERFEFLCENVKNMSDVEIVETQIFYNLKDCLFHALNEIKKGKEGTVMKTPDMRWRHETSKDQVKIKIEIDSDLEIYGYQYGAKDTKLENKIAVLSCRSKDEIVQVNVVIKNDAMRDIVNENIDDWMGRIIAVRYNDLTIDSKTGKQSLYLPRLADDQYRIDKTEADTYEDIFRQLQNPFEDLLKEYDLI